MDAEIFESHRPALLALAYRMLGDMARAEDMIQEAWVRLQSSTAEIEAPKAFLLTTVTHLCLDELGSARRRREESRGDRLPEPIDLAESGIGRVEMLDRISMAFLVLLQRLTPAERAVFLLHEVFDMSHGEIAELLGKNEAACRQLLRRAKENVVASRRVLETSREEHRRLLLAFVSAVTSGEQQRMTELLAEDAVLLADGGPNGTRFGRLRNTGRPVIGRRKVVSVMQAFSRQEQSTELAIEERELNGEPAIVAFHEGRAVAAILVSVADGRVHQVYVQIDAERLRRIAPLDPSKGVAS